MSQGTFTVPGIRVDLAPQPDVPAVPRTSFEAGRPGHAAPPPGSPFDALRHVREDGTEFWRARDLHGQLGYPRWADFTDALQRAFVACENAGKRVEDHFRTVTVLGQTGQQVAPVPRRDCELSRFGAYLLAMNGDPRKAEVARAQMYFAVKTREAEVQPELTRRQLLQLALEAEDERDRALEAVTEARQLLGRAEETLVRVQPKVEGFDTFLNTDGTKEIGVLAQELGQGRTRLFEFLRQERVLISTPGDRFNTPYQAHIETGRFVIKAGVRDSKSEGTKATYSARVTPKGEAFILRLIKERGSVEMIRALDRVTVGASPAVTRQ